MPVNSVQAGEPFSVAQRLEWLFDLVCLAWASRNTYVVRRGAWEPIGLL
jgi:hypothetical protein